MEAWRRRGSAERENSGDLQRVLMNLQLSFCTPKLLNFCIPKLHKNPPPQIAGQNFLELPKRLRVVANSTHLKN